MIFRKPYAFLIKYFRIINLLLALLATYVTYKMYHVFNFFRDYITNSYSGSFYPGFSEEYISFLVYFIIVLILFLLLCLIILFIYKKKPSRSYTFSFLYFVLVMIYLSYVSKTMITLETTVLKAESARLLRDVSLISIVPLIILIIFYILRTFGLNIKEFNFEKDLKDLQINAEDSEEIEISINNDGSKLKRTFRRLKREFQYYLKENRFIVIIVIILSLSGLVYFVFKSLPDIVDQKYHQGDAFNVMGINYNITDSILTNLDYQGNIIAKDKYYLVLKLSIDNSTDENYDLDLNKFRLEVDKNYIYPTKDKGTYFIDYAQEYYIVSIKKGEKKVISLIYEVSTKDVRKNYQVKIDNGITISKNKQIGRYTYVNISPIIVDTISNVGTYNLNDEISFVSSNLGNTKFLVSNYTITDKYIYEYEYCSLGICNTYKNQVSVNYMQNNRILLVLDYNYDIDKEVPFYNNQVSVSKFINKFMKIRYQVNDDMITDVVSDVTPKSVTDKIVLEVSGDIKKSDNVFLVITIRNKEYLLKLK